MKIMVSGASGYLGSKLTDHLLQRGFELHVLLRNEKKFQFLHPNLRVFDGDILDKSSIHRAMRGCEAVFHVAALARIWAPKLDDFYLTNVQGTRKMIQAAKEIGIKKFILTSTTGTIGPSSIYPNHEDSKPKQSLTSHYEKSKSQADEILLKEAEKGFPGIIVMPSRIFGPGLVPEVMGLNGLIKGYLKNRVIVAPNAEQALGNYTFLDDVVAGHLLALQNGQLGEKYILGGENISIKHLLTNIKNLSPVKGIIVRIPSYMIKSFAWFELWKAKNLNISPKITPEIADRISDDACFSFQKTKDHLGYQVTPFKEALKTTIEFYYKQLS